jgi:hypothetical protein
MDENPYKSPEARNASPEHKKNWLFREVHPLISFGVLALILLAGIVFGGAWPWVKDIFRVLHGR